jgi:Zn-dependent protease with chaperone function
MKQLNKKINTILLKVVTFGSVAFCFGQNPKVIDTTNYEFRKGLEVFYQNKAKENEIFARTITSKSIRKEYESIIKEKKTEFTDKIKKGVFIKDSKYQTLAEEILTKLKTANPEIKDIKILIGLNKFANAYNNGEDIVVINQPLFTMFENEQQLAFVVSHEIAHQILNHVKKGTLNYIENSQSETIKNKTKEIKNQKYHKNKSADLFLQKFIYQNRKTSRKKEIEADSLGFIFFNNIFPKQNHQAIKALQLLDLMDKETDSLSEKDYVSFFDFKAQPFKKQWIVNDEINQYTYNKTLKFWEIDSLKTHPDCKDRIAILSNRIKDFENEKTNDLEYKNNLAEAKYDYILALHFLKQYGDSLYQTLLLLKKEPKNEFLQKMVFENLTQIQAAQNNFSLNKHLETINPNYSNSYNTFLFFIRKLRKTELQNIIQQYKTNL